jgi:hypothetical protein
MPDTHRTSTKASTTHRIVTAAFGAFFTSIAVAIGLMSEPAVGSALAAIVIGIVGIDAMIGAWRDRPALLSRIGPLP